MQHLPLRVSSQGAVGLDYVLVAGQPRHYHNIEVNLAKETSNHQHGQGDMKVAGLVNLALVTAVHEPLDINDHQPSEVEEQANVDCEDTLVPEVIVSLLDQSVPPALQHH